MRCYWYYQDFWSPNPVLFQYVYLTNLELLKNTTCNLLYNIKTILLFLLGKLFSMFYYAQLCCFIDSFLFVLLLTALHMLYKQKASCASFSLCIVNCPLWQVCSHSYLPYIEAKCIIFLRPVKALNPAMLFPWLASWQHSHILLTSSQVEIYLSLVLILFSCVSLNI